MSVRTWRAGFFGELYDDHDPRFRSLLYGFDNRGADGPRRAFPLGENGGTFGYVAQGAVVACYGSINRTIRPREFFCLPPGSSLVVTEDSLVLGIKQVGWRPIPTVGGPIEERGRLRYIDRCSDSLLVAPPLLGDPCLNHLHFPAGIDQTEHFHPSTRAGIVARGSGLCRVEGGDVLPLAEGTVFMIPAGAVHAFQTTTSSMDVIAYHPDSDFGPEHERHPMVNRTLVVGTGARIDNAQGVHLEAEVISGHFQPGA